MLRITEYLENGKTIRLRLDGTISLQAFDELKRTCARYRENERRAVILDMSGVEFMNDEVASRLVGLQSESLLVINCSPFIATLLETVARIG